MRSDESEKLLGIKSKYGVFYKDGKHYIQENAAVIYKGDKILYAGSIKDAEDKYIEVEFQDLGESLVAPGFIDLDALGDIDHCLITTDFPKERSDDLRWSQDWFDQRVEQLSLEDEVFKSLYAYVQLIRHGVTTAMPITSVICKRDGETLEEIEGAAENAIKLGLRVYLGPSFVMQKPVFVDGRQVLIPLTEEEKESGLKNAEFFVKKWKEIDNPLVNPVVVPERIEQQTTESLKRSKEIAKKYDVPIRLHATQGTFEYEYIEKNYNMTPVQYLDSIGFLDEKTLIPHGLYLGTTKFTKDNTTTDMDILRDKGVSIIHCPLVYGRFGTALDSFGRYKHHGIKMSMGTDTFPPDFFENIRVGSFYARYIDEDREENNFASYYESATLGGARALGREDLGQLSEDAMADLIVIPLDDFSLGVIDDPLKTVLMMANGSNVRDVMIGGKWVMKNREIPGINLNELRQKAEVYYEKMKQSYIDRSNNNELNMDEFFPTIT